MLQRLLYLRAVMLTAEHSLLKREVAALPLSIKFEPMSHRRMTFEVSDAFETTHRNTTLVLTVATKLHGSHWQIVKPHSFTDAARRKLIKEGRLLVLHSTADQHLALHGFVRKHSSVNRRSSSSGKFKP